jgi:hypothetical protein
MQGRHVVMIGDSLTRYTYLNLVHYMETGKWIGKEPAMETEKAWPSWNTFYQVGMGNAGRKVACV